MTRAIAMPGCAALFIVTALVAQARGAYLDHPARAQALLAHERP